MHIRRLMRYIRHRRVRKKVIGTAQKPRLIIFKGARTLFAQVIDDTASKTLIGIASNSKELKSLIKGPNIEGAKILGKFIAEKCKEKGIKEVILDRGGYKYHGVIKSFADSVRENGVKI
ncbi:MAG: 50S ribosomal protein L18 [Candidatus Goldbacteria bacterium]|nr:50S ribosomal protein L18 [Candidatus Goldiibacteriota bacterium]